MKLSQSKTEFLSKTAGLPSEKDFDPYGGDLDAQCAWKNFGGMDLGSAFERFCENPTYYQEDFMFMGPLAFEFYFPVIERFLKQAQNDNKLEGDCEAWILGEVIFFQMRNSPSQELVEKIDGLCSYVQSHLEQYSPSKEDQSHIDAAWVKVGQRVTELM